MRARLLLALTVMGYSFAVSGEKIQSQGLKNQFLKEELALARAPSSYFVVDLQTRIFQLKASGLTLREWKIERLRRWGDPVPLRAISIEKKSALFAPKRKKIKPGANQEGETHELEVLELKDMPSSFSLCLDRGLYIYVRPRPETFLSRAWEIGRFLRWYTLIPLKNLWFEMKKEPLTALDIKVLNKEEAKSLYWALLEGHKGLIYPF
ncbi:MAG: hypothetical protein QHH14_06765 [Clostridiales bacterium]|nr:hypothetical protein [Clostridiales bacterium]